MQGKRIVELRAAYEMSQEELAHVLGVVWSTVSRWEREGRTPRGKPQRRLLLILENHQRAARAERRRIRDTLLQATELGLNVSTFLSDDNAASVQARMRQLITVMQDLARL